MPKYDEGDSSDSFLVKKILPLSAEPLEHVRDAVVAEVLWNLDGNAQDVHGLLDNVLAAAHAIALVVVRVRTANVMVESKETFSVRRQRGTVLKEIHKLRQERKCNQIKLLKVTKFAQPPGSVRQTPRRTRKLW